MSEIVLTIDGIDPYQLYGEKNSKLNLLREAFPEVSIVSRGNKIKISGDKKHTQKVKSKFETMVRLLKENEVLEINTIKELLNGTNPFKNHLSSNKSNNTTIIFGRNAKPIKAKTHNQRRLVEMSETKDIIFAIGPAGTGKTYTAVALAVKALKNKLVRKIILTRPAVEAGESLGFLPGDLKEKIDPYLRPLYDALEDMIKGDKLDKFMADRVIEVAPLAFMRGRTLDNAFIILDEAQNATNRQIKMFLTRLGPSAKIIMTGDLSQIDLPRNHQSGLHHSLDLIGNLEGVGKVFFDEHDVVRHRLVKEIIIAYSKDNDRRRGFIKSEEEE